MKMNLKKFSFPDYKALKKRKPRKFNLRFRLIFFVTVDLIISVGLAYGVDILLKLIFTKVLNINFEFPFAVDLMLMCLFVGIFSTYALSIWFVSPLKKLEKTIGKIADGDFSVRLPVKRSHTQEIQEIYSGFNLMAQELGTTEILQTDFVSNVSHEFKTPINAIEGYSMLLQDGDNLTAEQREYVEKILFNTKRLSSLTGSILLLSKLENQTIATNKSTFRLDEQIRQSIVALEPLWEKKQCDFDIEMNDTVYFGNEVLMHHVWDNLISNAIKFGPQNGTVKIRLASENTNIIFTVEDMGDGISEEAQKHIFDKFYQGDNSHKSEGNGLGLTLVKKILDLEEGEISAKNGESGGCVFTVKLKSSSFA